MRFSADHGEPHHHLCQEYPMVKKSAAAAFAALLGLSLFGSVAFAQDATPVADCASTPDDNIQIVTDYFTAVTSGDVALADDLLHDDFVHDLSSDGVEVPNEPGNADELSDANIAAAGTANIVIDATVASGDWVAVEYSFDVPGSAVTGADATATAHVEAMAFAKVECGEITEAHFEWDSLGLLLQLGFEVTPPAP
jgi:ketosteroid isomerase-like protein